MGTIYFQQRSITPIYDPISFAELMQLYAKNYRLMRQLSDELIAKKSKNSQVFTWLSERYGYRLKICRSGADRWTSTWVISYYLVEQQNLQPVATLIDVCVLIYHDSKQAAIAHPALVISNYLEGENILNDLVIKWHANYFLFNVLLLFCRYKDQQRKRSLYNRRLTAKKWRSV